MLQLTGLSRASKRIVVLCVLCLLHWQCAIDRNVRRCSAPEDLHSLKWMQLLFAGLTSREELL